MQERVRKNEVRGAARERLAVVVREGLKGNHLLFETSDLAACNGEIAAQSAELARELGRIGLALSRASSIDQARALVAAASPRCRAELARMYLVFLGRCASAQGNAS